MINFEQFTFSHPKVVSRLIMEDKDRQPDSELPSDGAEPQENQEAVIEPEGVGTGEPGDLSHEELQNLLQVKEQEAKDNEEKFLRQAAEMENYKKRVAREKEDAIKFANEALVRELLPVLDNLERAVEHARDGGNGEPLVDGIEMVLKTCLEALEKHGVSQVTAKGEVFDPERHEAYAQIETDDCPPNTVVNEVHRGYFLRDRLLRPSLVSVAKPVENKNK